MLEHSIAELARGQLSLVTLHQALLLGMSEQSVRRRYEVGRWERRHEGVYAIAGSQRSYGQNLLAACLAIGPDTAASHRAAAVFHGLLTYREPPIEVTTTRARSPELAGVTVHRLEDLHSQWVADIDQVPCTSPARTLVDLGAVCRPNTVEAAFDRAIGRRLVTPREVRRAMLAIARQGRRGVGTIRQLLADRLEDKPAGVLEARMASLLRDAMLPTAVPEYVVRDEHGGFVAIVDFAYPDHKLAIEVDGYEAHMGLRAFRHERSRDRALRSIEWEPLHFTWPEVDGRQAHVVQEIRDHIRRRSP